MNKLSIQNFLHEFYLSQNEKKSERYAEENLIKSTIIFAPHEDDETLGCGGTIILKKKAGADLKIVFMTDGSQSHPGLIPTEKLSSIRKNEAIQATKILGIAEKDLIFLEFPDSALALYRQEAIKKIQKIIECKRPQEIFVPYFQDINSDHVATNQIVLTALKQSNLSATVYEYPIWFWSLWPLTARGQTFSELKSCLKTIRINPFSGFHFLRDFRCYLDITEILEVKRRALQQHKSQMTRLLNNPQWRILGDVSDGDFLEHFFQTREIFYKH